MTGRFQMIARVRLSLFASVMIAAVATGAGAGAETLPLKHVIISSSGLAVYGHEGKVKDQTEIELPVRLDQVDDMLKSLVVVQPAGGRLEGISLPGREPLSQVFRDLPFNEKDISDYPTLLNALRGAAVSLDDGFITGRLMGVTRETVQLDNGLVTRHRISVHTDAGIKTAILEETSSLKLTEKEVQAQLDRALEAVFGNRVQDQRTLSIRTSGPERTIALVYITDAPLWKSSYRLVLPEEGEKTATLQGWAVLENTTATDWKDVSLTLMSGSPVTYHQALYESYYTSRPELPVRIMNRVMPRVDQGSMAMMDSAEELRANAVIMKSKRASYDAEDSVRGMFGGGIAGSPPMPQAEMSVAYESAEMPMMAPAPARLADVQAASAGQTASQMIFRFPQKVALPAGNTLMIPFSDRKVPADRVYLYQPDTNARHPLASVEITNDSDSGFPPGIITLYESGKGQIIHVGDAEMPLVPKSENRFISFALDTNTLIDREESQDKRLGLITIAKGTLHQKVLWLNTTKYTIKAPEDEARTVVIEHPRRQGWELDKPEGLEGEIARTDTHYRLRFKIKAGETASFRVVMRNEATETIALSHISPRDIDHRLAAVSGKEIPSDVRKALEKVRELRSVVYSYDQELQRLNQERNQLYNDQNRLRQNLQTVSQGTALGKRYLAQMEEQENRLSALAQKEQDLQTKQQKAQQDLDNYISGLKF